MMTIWLPTVSCCTVTTQDRRSRDRNEDPESADLTSSPHHALFFEPGLDGSRRRGFTYKMTGHREGRAPPPEAFPHGSIMQVIVCSLHRIGTGTAPDFPTQFRSSPALPSSLVTLVVASTHSGSARRKRTGRATRMLTKWTRHGAHDFSPSIAHRFCDARSVRYTTRPRLEQRGGKRRRQSCRWEPQWARDVDDDVGDDGCLHVYRRCDVIEVSRSEIRVRRTVRLVDTVSNITSTFLFTGRNSTAYP
jgi:hypothetical protein